MLSAASHYRVDKKNGLEQLIKLTAVLDSTECHLLRDIMISSPMVAGETSSIEKNQLAYQVDSRRRDVNIALLAPTVTSIINNKLERLQPVLASYYGIDLLGHESPQCLRYGPGQFYSRHRDSHPQDERSRNRSITVVIFLSNSKENGRSDSDFIGGGLRVYPYEDNDDYFDLEESCGNGIAFPSNMLHEVKPISTGTRYSIATWFFYGGA